ncbi:MAG: SDR family oxidoreductase [Spirochaetales bacterium]|jgi:NAD(P)-dependent dehydrogenase (short-subunit alcohol dehydrogenase family)|nr:SDR family oxidoreductase [Spirochaetales bacterium]
MRHVLVSGGTSTLGKAICSMFIAEGAIVYCGYSSSEQKAQELVRQLGPSLVPLLLDVTDQATIDEAARRITTLDVLVNNSGVFSVHPVDELKTEEVQRIFDINVTGLMRLTKSVLPFLKASKGSIVNVASINAFHPGFGQTVHYDASKGAVVSYTKSLARELAPFVRVNAVAPGLLKAPYLDEENPLRKLYEQRALLGCLVDADQVALAVQFLSRCSAMTAEVVTIDAGYLAG